MSSEVRFPSLRPLSVSLCAALAGAVLSGCSADVSRFDFPTSVALNDEPTGSIAAPTEPVKERANLGGETSDGQAYMPPQQPRGPDVSMGTLPDATPPSAAEPSRSVVAAVPPPSTSPAWNVDPSSSSAPPVAAAPARPMPVTAQPIEKGETIEVRPGDTLYGLSKRHRVSLSELMQVNDLKGPNLKPGQKLHLPARGLASEPARTAEASPPSAVMPVEAPADWTGSHVVKTGDSLYTIARQNKIKLDDLQRYNGIQDVRRVKPGTVLKLPGSAGSQVAANATTRSDAPPAYTPPPAAAPITVAPPPAASASSDAPATPTILNSHSKPAEEGRQVAVNTPTSATAPPASSAASGVSKLRWPAQGKVIAGFGQRPDGTHNDGINLAVPMGTEVHAAEAGVVAYAGNELKGYGNLILLRHDSGWVTAYAHGDELLVKRGDTVKRGQVIAKAGKTGQVDQPQVHFELRQGQRPVDPTPYMEKL